MPWSYNPLWKLLIDRGIKRSQLIDLVGIHSQTIASMGKNMTVSMESLEKICNKLDCRIEDIVEYVPEKKE